MTLRLPFQDDIVLGTTVPPLPVPQYRLSPQDQGYHATIWGRTGSGKSKLLQSVFLQLLNKGQGVGLIEPHHDLSFETLSYLVARGFFTDPTAFKRLVYIDWGNGAYVPFNVLAGNDDSQAAALNALEAMLRVWPELRDAPMFQTLFLSAAATLAENHLPITHLHRILGDEEFRRSCLAAVEDPLIHQSFAHFEQLGRDQASLAGSAFRRAFLLGYHKATRFTLGQSENGLPFREWMDKGISFIINLGNVNETKTRELLGALLMVQIEQAALSRTDLLPSQRKPFTLLIDEWPSFAAQDKTIGTILSQTRKFNLRLWLAAQSLSQISSERLVGAMENCRITLCFGVGRDSAEIQARHIGTADPFAVKEQSLTPTQHAQYLSIVDQFESWTQELQNLSPRYAYVKLHNSPAVKIKTLTVPDNQVSPGQIKPVLQEYRQRYQRSAEQLKGVAETTLEPIGRNGSLNSPAYTRVFSGASDAQEDSEPDGQKP